MTDLQGARPRLLAVVTIPPLPLDNGFSLRVANVLAELGRQWDITLVAPEPPEGTYQQELAGVSRLQTVRLVGRMFFSPSQYDSRPLQQRVDQLVAEIRPQVLLLWSGAEFVAFERPDFPPALVDRIDCATLTAWRAARMSQPLRARLSVLSDMLGHLLYERKVVRRLDTVIVVGADDARVMRRVGGRDNVHVVSNGVAFPDLAAAGGESPVPQVVFTGVMNYPPNVDAILYFAKQVFPLLRQRNAAATFVVAGRSPSPEVLALRDTRGIEVLADVPDMRAVIARAWVSVATMQSGSGVKNKILEAWAMAKPVVMTSLAANGLQLDAGATSLVADDPAELARLVDELLRDRERRHALGMQGRALVQGHHSWSQVAGTIDGLLRQLMEGAGR